MRDTAPVQGGWVIPWATHLQAFEIYRRMFGVQQTPEQLADRGGFHPTELDHYAPGWRSEALERPA